MIVDSAMFWQNLLFIAIVPFLSIELHAECPNINDLPVLNPAGNSFYCAFDWADTYPWKNDIPLEGCNGDKYELMDGTNWDTKSNKFYAIGGLIVKAGCTLYGYEVYPIH